MALFLEGVDSISQPCTLPLLVWALVFMLAAGRELPWSVAGYLVGLAAMAWARFTGLVSSGVASDHQVLAGAVTVAAILVVGCSPRWRLRRRPAVGVGAMCGGGLVAALWRPCVGTELGNVVSAAGDDRLGVIVPTIIYMAGLGSLIVAIGLLPVALPRLADLNDRRAVTRAGVVGGLVLGALVAVGLWAELVSELLRLSTV